MTSQLCSAVQWKKRANDRRPMIGHLINSITTFGSRPIWDNCVKKFDSRTSTFYYLGYFNFLAVLNYVAVTNKITPLSHSKLIQTIQQARRSLAYENQNKGREEAIWLEESNQRVDQQKLLEIEQRINQIREAIEASRSLGSPISSL